MALQGVGDPLKALVKIVDLTKFNPTDACQITRIEQSLNPGTVQN